MSDSTAAWRASLEARLNNTAVERGVPPARIRRQIAFHRLLARLPSDDSWALKGGFVLETRLEVARATVDLDLALSGVRASEFEMQDTLDALLDRLVDDDGFTFTVGLPRHIAAGELGQPGWRVPVAAVLAGRQFESLRIDVVSRTAEIQGAVEPLRIRAPIMGTRLHEITVPAVDVAQHAAEKFHAYSRVYAGNQPSTRVKDLVDLVLLAEAGLLDARACGARLRQVYLIRDEAAPPSTIPAAPASWRPRYAAMARELDLTVDDVDSACAIVTEFYAEAISAVTERTS